MSDPAQVLRDFQPKHDFFIGIDSDGCVFDSMEIKQKECFAPMFVKHHGLQALSKYARQVWEFVNLYSKTRGVNRFPAVAVEGNVVAFLELEPLEGHQDTNQNGSVFDTILRVYEERTERRR